MTYYNCLICMTRVPPEVLNVQGSIEGYYQNVHKSMNLLLNSKIQLPSSTAFTQAFFNSSKKLQDIKYDGTKFCLKCSNYLVKLLPTFQELQIIHDKLIKGKKIVTRLLLSSHLSSVRHNLGQELCQINKNIRSLIASELVDLGVVKIQDSIPLEEPGRSSIDDVDVNIKVELNDIDNYYDESVEPEPENNQQFENDDFDPPPASACSDLDVNGDNEKIRLDLDEKGHPTIPCNFEGCPQTFSCIENLQVHQCKFHFMCIICKVFFTSRNEVNDHRDEIHLKKFFCKAQKNCRRKFYNKVQLEEHIKYHTRSKPEMQKQKLPESVVVQNEEIEKEKEMMTCYLCPLDEQLNIYTMTNIKDHMEKVHNTDNTFKCKRVGCRKVFTTHLRVINHWVKGHQYLQNPKSYFCEKCGLVKSSEWSLKLHSKIHLPPEEREKAKINLCPKCPRAFDSKSKLKSHINKVHNSHGDICSICGVVVKCLRRHLKLVHEEGTTRVQCTLCPKIFKNESYLRSHNRQFHISERRFKCTFDNCEKAFKMMADLKTHFNTTGEKRKSCPHCSKVFIHPYNLVTHIATIHSDKKDFVCEAEGCGEAFKIKRYLTLHMKKNHGDLG